MSKVVLSEQETKIQKLLKIGDKATPEQKDELEYLQSKARIDDLKKNISRDGSFFKELYASDSPKKDAIERWAEELEVQFHYETSHNIQTKIKSVGEISTLIKSEMKSLGVSESIYSYVHKVLMFKYKAEDKMHSNKDEDYRETHSPENSSLNKDYSAENRILIETFCDAQIELIKKRREVYSNFPILSQMTVEERLLLETNIININASKLLELQSYDNRQKIPLYYQIFLFDAFMVQTNNEATNLYWVYVKLMNEKETQRRTGLFKKSAKGAVQLLSPEDRKLYEQTIEGIYKLRKKFRSLIKDDDSEFLDTISELTPKQAKKFVMGHVPELLDMLNPKTRDEAIQKGFYGVPCPSCGDFKVERKANDAQQQICFCHACGTSFETKSYPLCYRCRTPFFDEYMDMMLKTAKANDGISVDTACPKCGLDVVLKLKLMQKVVILS